MHLLYFSCCEVTISRGGGASFSHQRDHSKTSSLRVPGRQGRKTGKTTGTEGKGALAHGVWLKRPTSVPAQLTTGCLQISRNRTKKTPGEGNILNTLCNSSDSGFTLSDSSSLRHLWSHLVVFNIRRERRGEGKTS